MDRRVLADLAGMVVLAASLLVLHLVASSVWFSIKGPIYKAEFSMVDGSLAILGEPVGSSTFAKAESTYWKILGLLVLNYAALAVALATRRDVEGVPLLALSFVAILASLTLTIMRLVETGEAVYLSAVTSSFRLPQGVLEFEPHEMHISMGSRAALLPFMLSVAGAVLVVAPRLIRVEKKRMDHVDYASIAVALVLYSAFIVSILASSIPVAFPAWSPPKDSFTVWGGSVLVPEDFAGGTVIGGELVVGDIMVPPSFNGTHYVFTVPRSLSEKRTLEGSPTHVSARLVLYLRYPDAQAVFKSTNFTLYVQPIKPRFTFTLENGSLIFDAHGYPERGLEKLMIQWLAEDGSNRVVKVDLHENPRQHMVITAETGLARCYVWYIYLGEERVFSSYAGPG